MLGDDDRGAALQSTSISPQNTPLPPPLPGQMIAPEIEKMAEEFGDKVILSKIDCTTDNGNKKWAMGG